jgi:hypothetical protein
MTSSADPVLADFATPMSQRFIVWWPHGARKKKAEDRHAREAFAQNDRYSLEVQSRREYIMEENDESGAGSALLPID